MVLGRRYIDILIARNFLDVHALLARLQTRDDTMFNCMEADNNGVCVLKKPIENRKNVGNEDIDNVLEELVGVVMALELLLKCLIVLGVLFGAILLVKNW